MNPLQMAGAGFQLVAIIGLFSFLGWKLDAWMETSRHWYTLGFSLAGVVLGMYWFIRSFTKSS